MPSLDSGYQDPSLPADIFSVDWLACLCGSHTHTLTHLLGYRGPEHGTRVDGRTVLRCPSHTVTPHGLLRPLPVDTGRQRQIAVVASSRRSTLSC